MSVTFLTNEDGARIEGRIDSLNEEIAKLKEEGSGESGGEYFDAEGEFIEFETSEGADIDLVAQMRDYPSAWGALTLHHVNSENLFDFVERFGGAGATFEVGGAKVVLNADSTLYNDETLGNCFNRHIRRW